MVEIHDSRFSLETRETKGCCDVLAQGSRIFRKVALLFSGILLQRVGVILGKQLHFLSRNLTKDVMLFVRFERKS